MDENRFYILVSKKLCGEITAEENVELDILFAANPGYETIYLQLSAALEKPAPQPLYNDENPLKLLRIKLAAVDPLFANNNNSIDGSLETQPIPKRKLRATFILYSLFALLLFSVLGIFILQKQKASSQVIAKFDNNVSTRPGSKSQVKLSDGTLVILNADSKLTYPDNFLGNTREVTLEGEAFFTVTPNKQKPFIIHSKAMDIKVLGTVFNVKAYPGEKTSEATLLKGSIEVTLNNHTNEKIMLKPSEKITVSNMPKIQKAEQKPATGTSLKEVELIPLIAVDQVSLDKKENIFSEVGWTQNKLMFKNESLQEIANTMQRWYGQSIEIKSEKLKLQKFTGNFISETIVQVLQALQLSYNFSYKKENNSFVIY